MDVAIGTTAEGSGGSKTHWKNVGNWIFSLGGGAAAALSQDDQGGLHGSSRAPLRSREEDELVEMVQYIR